MSRPPPNNASEAAALLKLSHKKAPFDIFVDIGSGRAAPHSRWFLDEVGIPTAVAIDSGGHEAKLKCRGDMTISRGDFDKPLLGRDPYPYPLHRGLVWMSHALEHSTAPITALTGLAVTAENSMQNSVIAVTVPPAKSQIVGGHLNLYNAGLLLYQMVRAGIDCSDARIKTYGYNISVLVPFKRRAELPPLVNDCGDIETLSHLFPAPYNHHEFNGDIMEHNWRPL